MISRRRFVSASALGLAAITAKFDAGGAEIPPAPTSGRIPFLRTPTRKKHRANRYLRGVPTEQDLIRKLYSKIESSFSLGTNSPYPQHAYIVLCNPGIFIDPSMNLTKPADRKRLSDLLNSVPEPSFALVFQDSGVRVDSVYGQIIQNHISASYQLTAAQQAALRQALKTLNNNSLMSDYWRYQSLLAEASDALSAAQVDEQNGGKPVDSKLIVAFNKAKSDYEIKGHQYDVDSAQEIYDQLRGGDPAVWWGAVRKKFDDAQEKLVDTLPVYKDWMSDSGWTTMTMGTNDWENQTESSSTDVGGGFSAGWGLWRVGADANYHKDKGFHSGTTQNTNLSFEVMRANIIRDWLEPLVFRARNWDWNNPQTAISDGGDAPNGQTPTGLMPLYPTGVLLTRNVALTADFSHEESSYMNSVIDGSTSVGWGPFSFSGHYHHEEHSQRSQGSVVGTTIKTKPGDVQVLGFFCDVLPKCPYRDPQLHWPSKPS